jgi:hypothetical protein
MGIIQWGMIKQSKYFIILAIILLVATLTVQAEVSDSRPLYLYYFETDDVLLEAGQIQAYQFAAFEGEKVTIVVYGLDSLVRPEIVLKDETDEIAATGRSTVEQPHVRYIQFTASKDETFTFDVSAVEAAAGGGLARVMLVGGDPIDGDLTYLDTVNPLLPGRVFMVSGSDEIDTDVTTSQVGLRTGAEVLPVQRFREKPDIFVSRGSTQELPPLEERFSPNTSHQWFNEDGDKFYFFTVHAIPEQLTSVTAEVEYEALNLLTFFYFDYFFIVGAGSDPILLSQQTQPCSEVTLENRVDCERVAVVNTALTEDEVVGVEPLPPPPDNTTPETDFNFSCGSGYVNELVFYPYYEQFYYTTHYVDACYLSVTQTNPAPNVLQNNTQEIFVAGEGGDRVVAGDGDNLVVGDDSTRTVCEPYDATWYYWFYLYDYYNWYGIDSYSYNYNCSDTFIYGGSGGEGDRTDTSFPYDVPLMTDPPLFGDTVYGNGGNDFIYGGTGDDELLSGGSGNDTIAGDDVIINNNCTYTFNGQLVFYFYPYYYVDTNFNTNCTTTVSYTGSGADLIDGGDGDDTIYGGGGNDDLRGGNDDDTIYGDGATFTCPVNFRYTHENWSNLCPVPLVLTGFIGSGDDWIEGGSGSDTIFGGAGNDTINGGADSDTIFGNGGNDLFIDEPGSGADSYDGGVGLDTLDYSDFSLSAFTFDITHDGTNTTGCVTATTCAVGENFDEFVSVENFIGGSANDDFNLSGTFGNSDTTPIGISGSGGNGDDVTFDFGTTGYFLIAEVEDIDLCNDASCITTTDISDDPADYSGYTEVSTGLFIQVVGLLPAPSPAITSQRWNLSGVVGGSFDGRNDDDEYVMGNTPTVSINDTGSSGVDTVVYAVNAAALTVLATDETSFEVSDGSTTAALAGIENVTTGSANDIFLLHYNPDGVNNTYDAGENTSNSDVDTAVLDTTVNLTVTFTGNTAVVNATTTASNSDTLVNFENVETGSGDDSFVMNTAPDGKTLDGGGGRNDITYTDNTNTVVTLNTSNSLTIANASVMDTVLNFDTVTTGDGDDVVNLDVNAASTDSDYTVNAGGGFNIFNFIFNSNEPLTDTVNMTVSADGTDNVLDFSGVDTAVTIDTSSSSPQEIFTNFWLTLQGVFEAVFANEETVEPEPVVEAATVTNEIDSTGAETIAATVETCPTAVVDVTNDEATDTTETAPDATSTPDSSDCETTTELEPATTEVVVEVTAEVTVEPTTETSDITPEATSEPQPTVEATPTPEAPVPVEATPEPPATSTPAPEAPDQS